MSSEIQSSERGKEVQLEVELLLVMYEDAARDLRTRLRIQGYRIQARNRNDRGIKSREGSRALITAEAGRVALAAGRCEEVRRAVMIAVGATEGGELLGALGY
ncbi:hypothetical protein B0H11DRAFT_2260912 [Mycena galericulata]|nr:hypothetical protein B0H11DRAFT_2260912 [Mycena galericulata]